MMGCRGFVLACGLLALVLSPHLAGGIKFRVPLLKKSEEEKTLTISDRKCVLILQSSEWECISTTSTWWQAEGLVVTTSGALTTFKTRLMKVVKGRKAAHMIYPAPDVKMSIQEKKVVFTDTYSGFHATFDLEATISVGDSGDGEDGSPQDGSSAYGEDRNSEDGSSKLTFLDGRMKPLLDLVSTGKERYLSCMHKKWTLIRWGSRHGQGIALKGNSDNSYSWCRFRRLMGFAVRKAVLKIRPGSNVEMATADNHVSFTCRGTKVPTSTVFVRLGRAEGAVVEDGVSETPFGGDAEPSTSAEDQQKYYVLPVISPGVAPAQALKVPHGKVSSVEFNTDSEKWSVKQDQKSSVSKGTLLLSDSRDAVSGKRVTKVAKNRWGKRPKSSTTAVVVRGGNKVSFKRPLFRGKRKPVTMVDKRTKAKGYLPRQTYTLRNRAAADELAKSIEDPTGHVYIKYRRNGDQTFPEPLELVAHSTCILHFVSQWKCEATGPQEALPDRGLVLRSIHGGEDILQPYHRGKRGSQQAHKTELRTYIYPGSGVQMDTSGGWPFSSKRATFSTKNKENSATFELGPVFQLTTVQQTDGPERLSFAKLDMESGDHFKLRLYHTDSEFSEVDVSGRLGVIGYDQNQGQWYYHEQEGRHSSTGIAIVEYANSVMEAQLEHFKGPIPLKATAALSADARVAMSGGGGGKVTFKWEDGTKVFVKLGSSAPKLNNAWAIQRRDIPLKLTYGQRKRNKYMWTDRTLKYDVEILYSSSTEQIPIYEVYYEEGWHVRNSEDEGGVDSLEAGKALMILLTRQALKPGGSLQFSVLERLPVPPGGVVAVLKAVGAVRIKSQFIHPFQCAVISTPRSSGIKEVLRLLTETDMKLEA